jgi:MFS family permease
MKMMAFQKKLRNLHYGWVVAGAGVLVLLSSIGLGRWAYAMLLPGTQAGLHLSYAQMGLVGTGNFAGYLAAVLLSPFLVRRIYPRLTIVVGLLLIGCSMVVMSQCNGFTTLTLFFCLSGVGSGLANIPMVALTAPWYFADQRGKAVGIMLCGNGTGIVLSGFLIPHFNRIYGAEGWRAGWLTMGLIALAVAVAVGLLVRNHPAEMGLQPLGRGPVAMRDGSLPQKLAGSRSVLVRLSLLYLAFGLTSSVYGTFIVTSMIHEYGLTDRLAGIYWSWVGFCCLFSGVGFGTISDRIGRNYGLTLVFGIHTVAYALAGLKLGTAGLIVSVILFGLSIFGAPTIVTAAIGDYFGAAATTRVLSIATLFFAVGQTLGPVAAVAMAGSGAVFTHAYLAAALVTAGAALSAFTLPAKAKSLCAPSQS